MVLVFLPIILGLSANDPRERDSYSVERLCSSK